MDLAKGEQRTAEYMKIHPLGRVPALKLDDGSPLAENTAILPYLGSASGLWPGDPVREARGPFDRRLFRLERPSRARPHRPPRALHRGQVGLPRPSGHGQEDLPRLPQAIDGMYAGREWLSEGYSVLDPLRVSSSTSGEYGASCRFPS